MKRSLGFILFLFFAVSVFGQSSSDEAVTIGGKKFYKHIVKKGETVYGLSKDFNVAPRDIVLENPKAMEGINPGDTLRIPYPTVTTSAKPIDTGADKVSGQFIYHKVATKETLYSLAKLYKTTIFVLDSLNPVLKTKGLIAGQTLKIPAQPAILQPQAAPQPTPTPAPNPPPVVTHPTPPPVATQTVTPKDTAKEKQAFRNLVSQQHIDSVNKAKNNPIVAPEPTNPAALLRPSAPVAVDKAALKNRYNVALIMPFVSENVDTIRMNRLLDGSSQLPIYTQILTEFYQGAMVALDSLEKKGVKVDLHLYNITSAGDTSAYQMDSILKAPGFANSNLIIGPPSTVHFKIVARYAAQHHIPIVSPIVADNAILQGNTYTSKVAPSSLTEIERMADYVTGHYMKANIILLHHRDAADEVYFEAFKKRFKTDVLIYDEKDSVSVADYSDNLEILGHKILDNKNNVIVVPYQGASFVSKLVNKLANSKYADNDSIVLFGMHNWLSNDNLDMADLDTLNFHFPSNDYVNYSDSCTKGFIRTYRNDYYTEPSYYAYQGFDITYFYVGLLGKFGTALQDHLGDAKYNGVHTSFDMHKVNDNSGYDNNAIYILEYRNYGVFKGTL